LVSDIPAGDGKMANLFLQCTFFFDARLLFMASRYNREEVVASLGREINLNPPLTLGKYLVYLFAGFECVPIRFHL
jgi:hypothetical protein